VLSSEKSDGTAAAPFSSRECKSRVVIFDDSLLLLLSRFSEALHESLTDGDLLRMLCNTDGLISEVEVQHRENIQATFLSLLDGGFYLRREFPCLREQYNRAAVKCRDHDSSTVSYVNQV